MDYLAPEIYIPHRAPMNLIDRVIEITDKSVTCETKAIQGGKLQLFEKENGAFDAAVVIELMAQTVGVWAGVKRLNSNQESKPEGERDAELGLLLSARSLKIAIDEIPSGSTLTMTMNLLIDESRLTSFEGTVAIGENTVASGRLNVFQPTNDELKTLFP